ncbi:GANP protein, partial [Probosciger aterrimus]|nr:GANP protein [Probosciger aterrimus]
MLQDLISAQLISDYTIVELPGSISDLQGTTRISAAVGWLVSQCPESLELCSQTLQEYIEDGVDCEFGKCFYHDWKERRLAGLPSQEPGVIIELYNSVLQFLSDVASSEHLCDLSWPVTEFSEPGGNKQLPHLQWNTTDHLAWLKKAVLSFQIPYLDLPPLGAPWRPVCHMIFQYVSQIASSTRTQPLIQSQVENLLSKTYRKWKNRTSGNSDEDGPSVHEVPWDDILLACIDHKLRDWKPPKLRINPAVVSEATKPKAVQRVQQSVSCSITDACKVHFGCQFGACSSADHKAEELKLLRLAQGFLVFSAFPISWVSSFEEQLHQYLAEDINPLGDFLGLPLYLPQSLVSTPNVTCPLRKSPVSSAQEAGNPEGHKPLVEELNPTLSDRLKHLQRLLRANKEGEVASELHLSALLDMVDT